MCVRVCVCVQEGRCAAAVWWQRHRGVAFRQVSVGQSVGAAAEAQRWIEGIQQQQQQQQQQQLAVKHIFVS